MSDLKNIVRVSNLPICSNGIYINALFISMYAKKKKTFGTLVVLLFSCTL